MTALGWEANAVRVHPPDRTIHAGIGPERATTALARALAERRPDGIVSTGCAGALIVGLSPGTLLLADSVLTGGGARVATDLGLTDQLRELARQAGVTFCEGTILGSAMLVADTAAKRDLGTSTGCLAVDMESGALGLRAAEEGIPFAVARVILDGVEESVPGGLFDANGRLRPGRIFATLLRPSKLRTLAILARGRRRAEATLRALYK